jgi:23S rRNA U2552 (ribose-2'-O)-methylase RlmE/FtsJ
MSRERERRSPSPSGDGAYASAKRFEPRPRDSRGDRRDRFTRRIEWSDARPPPRRRDGRGDDRRRDGPQRGWTGRRSDAWYSADPAGAQFQVERQSDAIRGITASHKPDVAEVTEFFTLSAQRSLVELAQIIQSMDPSQIPTTKLAEPERMLGAGHSRREDIEALWKEKFRMDDLFDSGNGKLYYQSRNAMFPQDDTGAKNNRNRAAEKLMEINDSVAVLDSALPGAFIDISGGPGPFADVLMRRSEQREGFGFTVLSPYQQRSLVERQEAARAASGQAPQQQQISDAAPSVADADADADVTDAPVVSGDLRQAVHATEFVPSAVGQIDAGNIPHATDVWYAFLLQAPKFTPLAGVDERGDVFNGANAQHTADEIAKTGHQVALALVDCGWGVDKSASGEHQEHLQEVFSLRMILGELNIALSTLMPGGNLAVKIFDTFSEFTASMVYTVASLFEQSFIVKPRRSRLVNAERYLVGLRLKGARPAVVEEGDAEASAQNAEADALDVVRRHLTATLDNWNNDAVPESLYPLDTLRADPAFSTSFDESTQSLCDKSIVAVRAVMDEVDRRRARGSR